MSAEEAIKSTRQEMKLSDLYARMLHQAQIDSCIILNDNELWLITEVLKRIALCDHRDILIFSETHYVDLKKKEAPENF